MDVLKFYIHEEEHTVQATDVSPHTTLNTYLRQKANLTGTKNMCFEGGCGSCIVAATIKNPLTGREEILAVNSCLVPLYMCSGWKICTVESIGNSQTGYHPVQKALVQFNGTQCGYCSSGMVMNMYALYESGDFTMEGVENSFGGNICRCTGYRPIMSAFKSLASDASQDLLGKHSDIEDIPVCKKSREKCQAICPSPCRKSNRSLSFVSGDTKWYKVFSINEILDVLENYSDDSYMLVGGNTARGVYKKTKEPDVYIAVTDVESLLNHTINNNNLILGANMTLTNAMKLFHKLSKEYENFSYLSKLADHIDSIANVPVRNIGTLAGNLFMKHEHHEFPSDIYLILETVGATLTLVGIDRKEVSMNLVDFLFLDMRGKIIKNIVLPALDHTYKYQSYKITPRAQNAHGLVNAGFLLKLDSNNKVESARIVYGAINPSFVHAKNSENYLVGKDLFDNNTIQILFQTLDKELAPDYVLPDPTPEFRKKLAIALCYKFILNIAPEDKISARNKSGGKTYVRPVSRGTQDYQTNESLYPLTQPIPKIEGLAQSTGQAKYIMDMPDQPGQLYAAFVLTKAPPNSTITSIDASKALKIDGVKAFYDKKDIPGDNDFTPVEPFPGVFTRAEELFCSGVVRHYFQPVGLIVANSQELAEKAADMVQVNCVEKKENPLLTIRDVIAAKSKDKISQDGKKDAKKKGNDVKRVVKGAFDISWQYHYTMETQCCIVIPTEDGLDMYPSTQSTGAAQVAAAKVLKIPSNKINVVVRRIGGAYGSKISRNGLISCAAALAAYKLQKPVKLSMPLITNMNVIGKRNPFSMDYEVGVNDEGVIQYLNASLYTDTGSEGGNENLAPFILPAFGTAYNQDPWDITVYSTRTDTPTSTWCRAPATTEAIAAMENIVEHIAIELNLDPIEVRLKNFSQTTPNVEKYTKEIIEWAEVDRRKKEIEEFNKANRWIKKGISVVPMLYPLHYFGYWHVIVSIYELDGTVSVAHAGVEMGQGINTKVAQVCAYALGIPLESVSIKPTNSLTSPNAVSTGGSVTTEAVCLAVLHACDILKERMKLVREKMKNPSWKELVRQCYLEYVDLCATSLFHPKLPDLKEYSGYPIYGATCAEVETDILTGISHITRVDLLEDTGNSMSPEIDIGQVEGAFIMGVGYWTCEQIIFNKKGELLTNRTWNYKPPGVKDIPIDFRVKFPKNNPNPIGILKSKATAEPPICMSCSVAFAIRNAVGTARSEANANENKWYPINGPSTVESTFLNSLHDHKQYTL